MFQFNSENFKSIQGNGLDKIPAKILKPSAHIIATSLTFIFNLSRTTGIYIDEWKWARVTSTFHITYSEQSVRKKVFRQLYSYLGDLDRVMVVMLIV